MDWMVAEDQLLHCWIYSRSGGPWAAYLMEDL
jgi:hypothetical protein